MQVAATTSQLRMGRMLKLPAQCRVCWLSQERTVSGILLYFGLVFWRASSKQRLDPFRYLGRDGRRPRRTRCYVGLFSVPCLGEIDVVSGKCDRRDFHQMLLELCEVAAGLPFASRITGALPYDRSVVGQEAILYHAFVYLSSPW